MALLKKPLIFLLLFFSIISINCSSKLPKKQLTIKKSDGNTINVLAEVATTFDERQHGFMGRRNIPRGTGMLFVFEKDDILNFWMKDTPTALSIAYITKSGVICDILDMTPFSLTSVTSTSYARYALEVPKGWFIENGVATGDVLIIPSK